MGQKSCYDKRLPSALTKDRAERRLSAEFYTTALTSTQFDSGLTFVASLHRFDPTRQILICDLGLENVERAALEGIANVTVFRPGPEVFDAERTGLAFRVAVILQLFEAEGPEQAVIWIDPDLALYQSLDPVFGTITTEGGYLSATSPVTIDSIDEGFFGIRMDRENAALLRTCAKDSVQTDHQILTEFAHNAALRIYDSDTSVISDLKDLVGSESVVTKDWLRPPKKRLRHRDVLPGKPVLRHRGVVKDFQDLAFAFERRSACAVLGNGPSLAGIDLKSLDNMDTIGMNAAFRFWSRIGWYPTLYCCLDEIVGMSLKDEIIELVANRKSLGIEQFIVRKNLFDWLDSQGATDGVICFDIFQEGYDLLMSKPLTTGSHSLGWAAICGYDRMIMAGIDGYHVEQVSGSQLQDEIVLEIVSEEENPNYFFSDYQRLGDRYMLPNPSQGMHQRSWKHIKDRLPGRVRVVNANPASHVDVFTKMAFDDALDSLGLTKPTL